MVQGHLSKRGEAIKRYESFCCEPVWWPGGQTASYNIEVISKHNNNKSQGIVTAYLLYYSIQTFLLDLQPLLFVFWHIRALCDNAVISPLQFSPLYKLMCVWLNWDTAQHEKTTCGCIISLFHLTRVSAFIISMVFHTTRMQPPPNTT